ncbi:MAG: S-methyl-5-thioribose-1-phosphate isomerase [Bacteroidales bacterium]|nr:S-methyl-5-thioribose-1-phosphate isomerase [Bacteroidales bacterium]
MLVNNKEFRTVWMEEGRVYMIDQNLLPFEFKILGFNDYAEVCTAIRDMTIRGAGAIGAAAGFAMALAFVQAKDKNTDSFIGKARQEIEATRPTAYNLFYAVEKVFDAGMRSAAAAVQEARQIADKDAGDSQRIGRYGSELIGNNSGIGTHCNAGWLAFVDYGTALSPIYHAHAAGKELFVFVDETRPRSQGARLTAWELNQAGIPHAVIVDNAMAAFMAQGKVDMMIVGADRIAANGDVANKIGTLEKAIAANYFNIPFYVAAPSSTIDWNCKSGNAITIEQRDETEVLYQNGPDKDGIRHTIMVCSPGSVALNPAFDVTPASLVTAIITEHGIVKADTEGMRSVLM